MEPTNKIDQLEKRILHYQKKMLDLAKDSAKSDSRYGNEYDNEQIRVYQSLVIDLKKEIVALKRRQVSD